MRNGMAKFNWIETAIRGTAAGLGILGLAIGLSAAAPAAMAAGPAADTGIHAGDVMVGARFLAALPQVSSTVDNIGGSIALTNEYVPELYATYFFTPHIGVNAIAGMARFGATDKGSAAGDVSLGSVYLIPATITAQYHILPKGPFDPYVGAGGSYFMFFDAQPASSPVLNTKYDNAFGYAFEIGANYRIAHRWYANVDATKVMVHTVSNVDSTAGHVHANVSLDPWLVGVGVAYRF